MYRLKIWFCWVIFLGCLPHGKAQPYYFNRYQINDGLSNNTVICSMQDSFGFLWFGTKDGLDRFDGNNFKHFDILNEVRNTIANNIISLVEDEHKNIWIGTDQGIYIYNPFKESFRLLSKEFANADVPVIVIDNHNTIWFIADGIVHHHIPQKNTTERIHNRISATALHCGKNGQIFLGTISGQIFAVSDKGCYTEIIDFSKLYGNSDWYSIQKITEDKNGNLIIGTAKAGVARLTLYDKKVDWFLGLQQLNQFLYVRDILIKNDHEYWFATESGLFIYHTDTKKITNIRKSEDNPWGISDNALYSIVKDRDGGIWLTTYFGGVNYYNENNNLIEKFMSSKQGGQLLGTVVRIIAKDKQGNIWLGTENGGLSKLNPSTGEIENYSEHNAALTNNNIHGLLPLDEKILLGTFVYGMDIFDTNKKRVVTHIEPDGKNNSGLKSNFLYYFYTNRKGEVLVASTQGHYKFDHTSNTFQEITNVPLNNSYTTITEDWEGNIWLGTWRDGIYMYNPDSPGHIHFVHDPQQDNSLPNNKINCLFQDRKGTIWVATEGGVARIIKDKSGKHQLKAVNLHLPSKIVLAILEDRQGNLWISTSKGLIRYNPSTQHHRLFNLESGLPAIQFNYNSAFDDGEGTFYFGTINGLIRFSPEKLNKINYNPNTPIFITKLLVNNKEIDLRTENTVLTQSILFTDEVVLKYDQSSFSLDFTALQYDAPKSIRYSYKLVGVNTDWVTVTQANRAHFTKVLPGTYEFVVKAEDPNGNPISSIRTLKIKILPPFWASIPAFIIYALLFIGLIAFIAYHFKEKVKQRNQQHLLKIQNLREQQLYQAKMDFYTDVVHEIRTPLTLIKAPLEKLILKIPANPVTDKLLQTIQNNTERLIELSNQLLDFRKVDNKAFKFKFEKKNIGLLTQDIITDFKVTLESQNKTLRSSIPQHLECYIDVEAYEKICTNLLNNALKYSHTYIEVVLQQDDKRESLILTIKNDGKVIPPDDRAYIFEPFSRLQRSKSIPGSGLGLALSQSLALKLHGTLKYEVDNKNLNTFTLVLPLNQTHIYEYES